MHTVCGIYTECNPISQCEGKTGSGKEGRGVWDGGRDEEWEGGRGEVLEVAVEGDMQKKITRWASGVGVQQELFPGLSQETEELPTEGLVVVASLLNKIPNLGGQCVGVYMTSNSHTQHM